MSVALTNPLIICIALYGLYQIYNETLETTLSLIRTLITLNYSPDLGFSGCRGDRCLSLVVWLSSWIVVYFPSNQMFLSGALFLQQLVTFPSHREGLSSVHLYLNITTIRHFLTGVHEFSSSLKTAYLTIRNYFQLRMGNKMSLSLLLAQVKLINHKLHSTRKLPQSAASKQHSHSAA